MPLLRLSIVVPTFNESKNVKELISRIEKTIGPDGWEMIFVDDNSPDCTAAILRGIARDDARVRCLQRIGRRGLSSACIEGMLAASAEIIAVMDADLQHDESILPKMLSAVEESGAEVVVGTRYTDGGSLEGLTGSRKIMSHVATIAGQSILKQPVSDPMSGFFMLQRQVFDSSVSNLSGLGFKILLDLLATVKRPLRITEIPYRFRERFAGESKLDEMVVWEYGMLLADKTIGRFIPVRFLAFSIIGGVGVFIHMAILTASLKGLAWNFSTAQSISTGVAMLFNFALNNILTYRDRRLKKMGEWLKGLASFVAACSIGAFTNVGIATYLFENETQWVLAALSGVLVGAVWNYAVTQIYTWGKDK
ncbi:MAG: glycosyltransferase family 2 protein [Nitrospirota bacterium]